MLWYAWYGIAARVYARGNFERGGTDLLSREQRAAVRCFIDAKFGHGQYPGAYVQSINALLPPHHFSGVLRCFIY